MVHTLTEENYLKAIFRISQNADVKITPTAIAEMLKNNPASVIDMIKKLSDKKLIDYDKREGVKLTESGLERCHPDSTETPAMGGFFTGKTKL
jgi:DtxR family Mn-dependent transcriptional regulator